MMKRNPTPKPPSRAREGVCEVNLVDSDKVEEARAAQPSDQELRRAADAFRVLANPNRLRVMRALQGRELCVCDLREVLDISMSGTSQVLRELRKLGAVEFRAEGKLAYYRLADAYWLELAESVFDKLAAVGAR
jgi:ArsR family transcriptional regulator